MPEQRTDSLSVNEPKNSPPNNPTDFDINHYLEMAKDFDMSEQEKIELLTVLWDIMRRFVELGFGVDSVSLLGDEIAEKPSKIEGFEVE